MKEIIGHHALVRKVRRITCEDLSCGTIFKFTEDETVGVPGRRGKYVTCPACNLPLAVNSHTAKIWEVYDREGTIISADKYNHEGCTALNFAFLRGKERDRGSKEDR